MRKFFIALVIGAVLVALPALADERTGPVGKMSVSASAVEWQAIGATSGRLTLTVQTPSGAVITREFTGSRATFSPKDLVPRLVENGIYHYELVQGPIISDETRQALAAARAHDDDAAIARIKAEAGISEPVVQSGAFTIANGSFVTDAVEPAAGGGKLQPKEESVHLNPAANDIVQTQNEEIQGSLCVGLDCASGESFGFDTIKVKENNTRIHFQDTSTSPGFPNVSWQLTANDSASGGANKFSIDDLTNSKTPFTVTAAAPTNSLFVASTGKVGFGNNSPVLNLHITAGDTPAIRQEQNTSGGFTAQTWDIGANEANWFVRDVTGGSRLPLRIRPGAPTSSIDIQASGNVGIGTASGGTTLDVNGVSRGVTIAATGNSSTGLTSSVARLGVAGSTGYLQSFNFATSVWNPLQIDASPILFTISGTEKMRLDSSGNLGLGVTTPTNPIQHSSGAVLTAGGVWQNASSRAIKQDISDLSSADAEAAFKELTPVHYAYKVDPNEKHVGFIAEDVPDLVAAKDHKSLSAMDIVAVLTKVVQDQQKTIDELKARLDEMQKKQ